MAHRFVLITDSTVDENAGYYAENDIPYAPLSLTVDGRTLEEDCGQTLSFHDFYDLLRQGKQASTAQAKMDCFLRLFEQALAAGQDVLYVGFSSGLSGTYQAGCMAVDTIREETGVAFPEDEAGFIAMHFVNAVVGGELPEVYDMTRLLQRVCALVRTRCGVDPDRDSVDFYRFVAHLKFLARRIAAGQNYGDRDADLLPAVRAKYPTAYACAQAICDQIRRDKGFDAGQNELLCLTLHIARVTGTS